MRELTETERGILSQHALWLDSGGRAGTRADLRWANLRGADLREVDLRGANLREAGLDFSCWPLWCGSRNVKADDRLVAQLLWHVTRLDVSGCSGGVREAVEHIRSMAIADLFCEYRHDIS